MRIKCTRYLECRESSLAHSEKSIIVALVTTTLNKTKLYILLPNVALIKKTKINIIMLEEHILFYTEDMYSKKLNNALK